jgi:mono/diheme cytochrome c family protein
MMVSWRWWTSKRSLTFLHTLIAGLVCLPGCEDAYSAARKYPIRTDPVLKRDSKPAEEFANPDRPGKLPLTSLKDLDDPFNPYYAHRDKLSKALVDPKALASEQRGELEAVLTEHFGTPAHPKVEGIPTKSVDQLRLGDDVLKRGSYLYRIHCLHCHGLTGDGRGPTAKWVNPHPRDYRPGWFKFQSSDVIAAGRTQKPRRGDLFRTMQHGIEGTSMPAFNLLADDELDDLVSYVIHLSLRGNLEYRLFTKAIFDEGAGTWGIRGDVRKFLATELKTIVAEWSEAQGNVIRPGPYKTSTTSKEVMKASVQRGHQIFLGTAKTGKDVAINCITCHKDYGRQVNYKFDDWGTLVRVADLTTGVYRGGRRPIDLYYRIHSGIDPAGMSPQGENLLFDDIWDIVNFLQALPYPAMRKDYGININ